MVNLNQAPGDRQPEPNARILAGFPWLLQDRDRRRIVSDKPRSPKERRKEIEIIAERALENRKDRATKEDAAIADLIFMCGEIHQRITKYQKVLSKGLEDPDTTIEEIEPIAKRLSACYEALFWEHHMTKYPNELITEAIRCAIEDFKEIQWRAKEGGHKAIESLCEADPEAKRLVEEYRGDLNFPVDKILKRKASELAISYLAIIGDERHIRRKIAKIFLLA
jgi:hypothetical protein